MKWFIAIFFMVLFIWGVFTRNPRMDASARMLCLFFGLIEIISSPCWIGS